MDVGREEKKKGDEGKGNSVRSRVGNGSGYWMEVDTSVWGSRWKLAEERKRSRGMVGGFSADDCER